MSKIEIDFNKLKYNLYDILNLHSDADMASIKKKFMKAIRMLHPDKNSDVDEEIYNHIILANQILLNPDSRKKYDEYLTGTAESFEEMKKGFNKSMENIDHYFPSTKEESIKNFNLKFEELNKKHGYSDALNNLSVMEKFNEVKNNRDNITINKEEYKNMDEFNDKFNYNKLDGNKFSEQLIELNPESNEIREFISCDQYVSINDIDKLYIDGSIQDSNYTSLDMAFRLQKPINNIDLNKSVEDRIKEYKQQTDMFKEMKPQDFKRDKFDRW
jgi:curved DNA-binding protein CbpA